MGINQKGQTTANVKKVRMNESDIGAQLVDIAYANILNGDKSHIYITPILMGRSGIGKSQVIKTLFTKRFGGHCFTINKNGLCFGDLALPVVSGSLDAAAVPSLERSMTDARGRLSAIESDKNLSAEDKASEENKVGIECEDINNKLIQARSRSVKFVLHDTFQQIKNVMDVYVYTLQHGGMLGGDLYADKDFNLYYKGGKDGKPQLVSQPITSIEHVIKGDEFKYRVIEQIPPELRLKLVTITKNAETGEITKAGDIAIDGLFLDEINRGDKDVMNELMNVLLNKTIHQFTLPWFVQLIGAMNPAEDDDALSDSGNGTIVNFVNPLDDASYKRLTVLNVVFDQDSFSEYMGDSGFNSDLAAAVLLNSKFLVDGDICPRDVEMVNNYMNTEKAVSESPFLSPEERRLSGDKRVSGYEDRIHDFIREKFGMQVGDTIIASMSNHDSMVNVVDEIITPEKVSNITLRKLDFKNNNKVSRSYICYILRSIVYTLSKNIDVYLKSKDDITRVLNNIKDCLDVINDDTLQYAYAHALTLSQNMKVFTKIYKTVDVGKIRANNKAYNDTEKAI